MQTILPIRFEEGRVILLDQTRLPEETVFVSVRTPEEMAHAIKTMVVRGAPAIGIAGAFGLQLAAASSAATDVRGLLSDIEKAGAVLAASRPTAVNLFYALERVSGVVRGLAAEGGAGAEVAAIREAVLAEAQAILEEEEAACKAIGEYGLTLLTPGMRLLTHCNAGGLATIRYGTALAPMLLGAERGITFTVYADETRPLLQGARLTAWELMNAGVDVTLITDSMAGMLMAQGRIDAVITGSDRIAANGDFANKIGTYSVAVLARHHGIPFYVAAPTSTIDKATPTGAQIVIEERAPEEVTCGLGRRTAPAGVKVYNPAFDVTPAALATAIITERGVLTPPYPEAIAALG
ncbi:MAG: S-methyl-5-thioribose-1-phosphate isomerase [Clostridiales Family XIII bacterium]|jgi:methylthioribose-1-phosphate isomerase|nr:S-methyl-5-thioribose-1-phosphate isomerase [Clostridiales Family XIII bacterium]